MCGELQQKEGSTIFVRVHGTAALALRRAIRLGEPLLATAAPLRLRPVADPRSCDAPMPLELAAHQRTPMLAYDERVVPDLPPQAIYPSRRAFELLLLAVDLKCAARAALRGVPPLARSSSDPWPNGLAPTDSPAPGVSVALAARPTRHRPHAAGMRRGRAVRGGGEVDGIRVRASEARQLCRGARRAVRAAGATLASRRLALILVLAARAAVAHRRVELRIEGARRTWGWRIRADRTERPGRTNVTIIERAEEANDGENSLVGVIAAAARLRRARA